MEALHYASLMCPYCGEQIECAIDTSAVPQRYIEDCSVCCRPIEVSVWIGGTGYEIEARRDDE